MTFASKPVLKVLPPPSAWLRLCRVFGLVWCSVFTGVSTTQAQAALKNADLDAVMSACLDTRGTAKQDLVQLGWQRLAPEALERVEKLTFDAALLGALSHTNLPLGDAETYARKKTEKRMASVRHVAEKTNIIDESIFLAPFGIVSVLRIPDVGTKCELIAMHSDDKKWHPEISGYKLTSAPSSLNRRPDLVPETRFTSSNLKLDGHFVSIFFLTMSETDLTVFQNEGKLQNANTRVLIDANFSARLARKERDDK